MLSNALPNSPSSPAVSGSPLRALRSPALRRFAAAASRWTGWTMSRSPSSQAASSANAAAAPSQARSRANRCWRARPPRPREWPRSRGRRPPARPRPWCQTRPGTPGQRRPPPASPPRAGPVRSGRAAGPPRPGRCGPRPESSRRRAPLIEHRERRVGGPFRVDQIAVEPGQVDSERQHLLHLAVRSTTG